jgi:hypothetical protein
MRLLPVHRTLCSQILHAQPRLGREQEVARYSWIMSLEANDDLENGNREHI